MLSSALKACVRRVVSGSSAVFRAASSVSAKQEMEHIGENGCSDALEMAADCPVNSYNEWDCLEEVIVGRPDGARVPKLGTEVKATIKPGNWPWISKFSGKPHELQRVQKATEQVNEFCRVLEMEGVRVRRPDVINWWETGDYKTPDFEEGGLHMSCPRDSLLVVGNEIIEAPMSWRARYFETRPYKSLLNEYFRAGAKWTLAPKPTMTDHMYRQDYPYHDPEKRMEMAKRGEYILTEAEPAFDAADVFRCGKDLFVQISHVTNNAGYEWLKRHLAPTYQVHKINCEDPYALHIDATFMPIRPGLFLANPDRPCQQADMLMKGGWDIIKAPRPAKVEDNLYTSNWLSLNTLNIDEKRVIVYSREEPLMKLFRELGMTPIPVDLTDAFVFGGAFHCWTCDVRRKGTLQSYFDW